MKKRGSGKHAAATAAILLMGATMARAADPAAPDGSHGAYLNRPGATVAELDAALGSCAIRVAHTTSSVYAGGGLAGALVGGIAGGMQKSMQRGRNGETCMVVGGWRVVALDAAQAEALKGAVAKDRSTALAPLVGADPVRVGVIERVWANDYAEPRIIDEPTK